MVAYIIKDDSRDYTDTISFKEEKQECINQGMSEKDIEELTKLYHNFDVWGNDKGRDYSRMEIAYDVSKLGYQNLVR